MTELSKVGTTRAQERADQQSSQMQPTGDQRMEIGAINLRNPAGYKTKISVSRHGDGKVDLHFSRTSEGEVLVILPPSIAHQLSELLSRAAAKATGAA